MKGKEIWRDKAGQKERMRVVLTTLSCSMWQCADASCGLMENIRELFLSYRNRMACKSFLPWGIKVLSAVVFIDLLAVAGGKGRRKCEFDLDSTSQEIAERLCEGHITHKTALKRSSTCKAAIQRNCWTFRVIQRSKNKQQLKNQQHKMSN